MEFHRWVHKIVDASKTAMLNTPLRRSEYLSEQSLILGKWHSIDLKNKCFIRRILPNARRVFPGFLKTNALFADYFRNALRRLARFSKINTSFTEHFRMLARLLNQLFYSVDIFEFPENACSIWETNTSLAEYFRVVDMLYFINKCFIHQIFENVPSIIKSNVLFIGYFPTPA